MSKPYSREYECELRQRLNDFEVDAENILDYVLSYVDSDTSCAALEDFCRDWDIPYESEEEEDDD